MILGTRPPSIVPSTIDFQVEGNLSAHAAYPKRAQAPSIMKADRSPSLRPFTALLAGIVLLATGIALARLWLPEWQDGVRDKSFYVQRYRELASRAGVRLKDGEPRVALAVENDRNESQNKELDGLTARQASALGAGLRIEVVQSGTPPGVKKSRPFSIVLSPEGQPLALSWILIPEAVAEDRSLPSPPTQDRIAALSRLLLAPGERLDERRGKEAGYDVLGSEPPQHLVVEGPSSEAVEIRRELGRYEPKSDRSPREFLPLILLFMLPHGLGVLAVAVLFFVLISRQRIDYANGLFLGALSFLASIAGAAAQPTWQEVLAQVLVAVLLGLCIAAFWAVGESFLRSVRPGFTTSLDSLRARRLGPRGGRALLHGLALGAALAGLRLALFVAASAVPGTWPDESSLSLPPLGQMTPFSDGILLAASMAVGLSFALRYRPDRWVPWTATAVGGLAITPVLISLGPLPAALAANLAVAGFLIWVLRKLGLTALLVAATASFLLPAAVFSALHLAWLALPFAITAGCLVALTALGWVGLHQSEQIEREGSKAPAFIRRIEEERRLRHEMDLLARMQLGLLPAQLPEVPGWEIAVRSLLATEASGDLYDFLDDERGDLWIAAGDVAGHGYSCSIAQAMTAAALSSLVGASQTPSGVLQRIDRVLRRNGAHRNFTTLALLRLDPRTGEGRLANAGHPFPLLVVEGEAAEVSLAGLPLGQGPKREYKETVLQIPPGGVLVFCSDGLFEGADWQGVPYGYDRPREILGALSGQTAAEILEALLADWRRHLGAQEHQDDTTVLVVKRTG
jgi:hypothetical protein